MSDLIQIAELAGLKTPLLAKLSNEKKIREYEETKKMAIVAILVTDLFNLLAVKNDVKEHTDALIHHIAHNVSKYSPEQIRHAFKLYMNNEFELDVYQTLNAVVFGKVMKAFDSYEQLKLKNYRLKIQEFKNKAIPMTQEEKDQYMEEAIEKALKIYKMTEAITLPSPKYDYLDSKGRLQKAFKMSDEQWKAYKLTKYSKVQEELKLKYQNKKAKSRDEKNDIRNYIKELENKKNGLVIIECKKQILESYFDTLI